MTYNYDPFVIPFSAGVIILLSILAFKYLKWIFTLPKADKFKIVKGIFSIRIIKAAKEVLMESLLHRKIFRVNPLLGYMHMSLAFGWFLLILGGTVENKIHSQRAFNAPYEPIFFKFFNHDIATQPWANEFKFIMDLILLVILSGVVLAFSKRFFSRLFGMKKTTRLKFFDWVALTTLWFIFPLRFLAESFTSGLYHNGGFLTGSAGEFFASFLPVEHLYYPAWWAYSMALGCFFVSLPFSRYMHIITEVVLIFLRNFGIKSCKVFNSYSDIEVHSCPRCGICLDKCQLLASARIKDTQSVYFLQDIRNKSVKENKAFECMLCGRCQEFCPVSIDLNNLRISQRHEFATNKQNYSYINPAPIQSAPVIYFAGCMTHLTPSIKNAMEAIFKEAGTDYLFLDKEGTICCGRPLMAAGEITKAHQLVEKNRNMILLSGAHTLVTSCPICLKVFKKDYLLNIDVVHHSQYILQMANEGKINLSKSPDTAVYHDPCELGRGCGIYSEPRELLNKLVDLKPIKQEAELGLCCGNSIGGIHLSSVNRDHIRMDMLTALQINNPDCIVTACPLCKKTIANGADAQVKDIAEVAYASMQHVKKKEMIYEN